MKEVLGIVAGALVIAGYAPYIRDIIRGKTHPHLYSWLLWGLLTVVIFGIQITHHAGFGGLVTIVAGIMCLLVIFFGAKHGKRDITLSDNVVLVLTLVCMVLWLAAKQPLTAILLACATDLLAFMPTVRKSWNKPFSETLSLYQLNTVRFAIAVIALEQYTFINMVWPAMWAVANGLFAIMLVARRQQFAPEK
jgi:hypothetical protein